MLILVSNVYSEGREIDIDDFRNVSVYMVTYSRYPKNIKLRFRPWKIYSGEITIGRKKFYINWLMQVPTYHRYTTMFCVIQMILRGMKGEG